jgi:hypothetical protein
MTHPIPRESLIMNIRTLIKNIWTEDLDRNKDEFTYIDYSNGTSNFVKISIDEKSVEIHKSNFEDYFNARDDTQRNLVKKNIIKSFEDLI